MNGGRAKQLTRCAAVAVAAIGFAAAVTTAALRLKGDRAGAAGGGGGLEVVQPAPLKVYEVSRKVLGFPTTEDFSTPETAYAVINRVLASGEQSSWRRISVAALADRLPPSDAPREDVRPEDAQMWLNARILEVRMFQDRHAAVIAELSREGKPPRFDHRVVDQENGKWLNGGHATYPTIEEARAAFSQSCAQYVERPGRPAVDDPEAYLKPFVEFLKSHGEDPKAFVMKALADHRLVIMGEYHHRPRYWAFNSSLVTHPDFPKYVGTIYMELPANDQDLVNRFLAAERCDRAPVIEMLRDVLWMGWPDQPMLDFLMTVWQVNQDLESNRRVRIVLVDMQRPWKDIRERRDWAKYERVSRDRQMSDNIVADMREHPAESRNSLFIVGVGHTMLDMEYFDGSPVMTAGRHLQRELGPQDVYAFFPHGPVGTNQGRIDGRVCLGLFDSAFAAIGNTPIAFPLTTGPFGEQPFDALSDLNPRGRYRDGYSAYLYLGPLEHEIFSPLIAGFYTDAFVQELDRRYRLMFGQGLVEGCHLAGLDAEGFIQWMSHSYGRPRSDWNEGTLGPITAWQRGGSDWKETIRDYKHAHAMAHPEKKEIVDAAKQLFESIRRADYDYFLNSTKPDVWKEFPPPLGAAYYCVSTDYPSWVAWVCTTFRRNPIVQVELGEVFLKEKALEEDLPAVPYKLTLRDGAVLEGDLPFQFSAQLGRWVGLFGLDWHLQPNR